MRQTVAIIGGGGRESVLLEKYSQSGKVAKLIAIPGNDLMQFLTEKPVLTFPKTKTTDVKKILKICYENKVDLVDVVQDDAIAAGVTDILRSNGFSVVGPSKGAGKIEWSKSFSRELLKDIGILQPEFYIFDHQKDGIEFVRSQPNQPWFVKADGLASGKGAMGTRNNSEAIEKIKELYKFGKAGQKFLIEKFLKNEGELAEEFSAFAISDGKDFKILGYAQDHKRANDGDLGENTGGMGASFPPKVIDENIEKQVAEIFKKTFSALEAKGYPYIGVLFLGGILVGKKVFVIEFNARWGDPEAQVIVPSIKNDFFDLSTAVVSRNLGGAKLKIIKDVRVCVAICPKGYPNLKNQNGKEVKGLMKYMNDKEVKIYPAGVRLIEGKIVLTSGRSFHIVASGSNINIARRNAYAFINNILDEGNKLHFRTDIGWRDINR